MLTPSLKAAGLFVLHRGLIDHIGILALIHLTRI